MSHCGNLLLYEIFSFITVTDIVQTIHPAWHAVEWKKIVFMALYDSARYGHLQEHEDDEKLAVHLWTSIYGSQL
jgi:hypothetical protein